MTAYLIAAAGVLLAAVVLLVLSARAHHRISTAGAWVCPVVSRAEALTATHATVIWAAMFMLAQIKWMAQLLSRSAERAVNYDVWVWLIVDAAAVYLLISRLRINLDVASRAAPEAAPGECRCKP